MWVPKLLLPPAKSRIFGLNTAKFGPKYTLFGHFGPNIGLSDPFGAMPDQKNNANDMSNWFFDMWVQELLLPPNKIRLFGPKTAIFALNMLCEHI